MKSHQLHKRLFSKSDKYWFINYYYWISFSQENVLSIFLHRSSKENLPAQKWLSMDKKVQAAKQEPTHDTKKTSGKQSSLQASENHKYFCDYILFQNSVFMPNKRVTCIMTCPKAKDTVNLNCFNQLEINIWHKWTENLFNPVVKQCHISITYPYTNMECQCSQQVFQRKSEEYIWSYRAHSLHAYVLHQMKVSSKRTQQDRSDDQLEQALIQK